MSYFSNSGPTTRRYGDLSWPNIRSVWDGKDNENYLYKTYVLSRYTTFISASFAAFDISVLPRVEPGLASAFGRVKFYCVPAIGAGLAYTTAVHISGNVRGKTDQWNHWYGGAAAGAVVGKCAKSVLTGVLMGFALGLAGFMMKDAAMFDQFPGHKPFKKYGGSFYHKWDYSCPPRQGYWVRTPEEVPKMMERGPL